MSSTQMKWYHLRKLVLQAVEVKVAIALMFNIRAIESEVVFTRRNLTVFQHNALFSLLSMLRSSTPALFLPSLPYDFLFILEVTIFSSSTFSFFLTSFNWFTWPKMRKIGLQELFFLLNFLDYIFWTVLI